MNPNDAPDAAELAVNMRANNLVTWLQFEALALGTDNQRERFKEHALPTEELLALARGELYKPLEGWTRWKNRDLHAREVRHEGSCAGRHNDVTYSSIGGASLPPMDGDAWNRLTELRHAVNQISVHEWLTRSHVKVDIEVTKHEARCSQCRRVAVRYTARVMIPWATHKLVREYVLSPLSSTVRP